MVQGDELGVGRSWYFGMVDSLLSGLGSCSCQDYSAVLIGKRWINLPLSISCITLRWTSIPSRRRNTLSRFMLQKLG